MNIAQNIRSKVSNVNPDWYFTVLMAFVFFEYVRPQQSYLSFISIFKFPFMTLVLLAFIFFKHKKDYIKEEVGYKLFIAFWFLASFTIIFAVNTRATYDVSVNMAWVGVSFIFPLVIILNDTEKLFKFFNIWILSHFLLALTVIHRGGTGPGGILGDENDVACAMAMAVPYVFYLFYFPGINKKIKIFLLVTGVALVLAVVVSASRGSMLGLIAAVIMLTYMSKYPFRNSIKIILFVLIFGGFVLSLLSEAYIADMANMTNPEDSTRDDRLWSWSIAWVMFLHNPIWGVAAGNYPWTNHMYAELSPMWYEGRHILNGRASHSLYFTLLPELGIVGTVLYLSVIKVIYSRCRKIKAIVSQFPSDVTAVKIRLLVSAYQASLVSFLVSSVFISVLFYPFFWHLLGLVLVTHKLVKDKYIDELDNNTHTSSREKLILTRK